MFSEEIIKFYTAASSAEHPTEQGYEGTHIVISQIQRYLPSHLPAARSSRALSKRIRCRHSLKLKPVSARNRRVSVRDDMPAQAAHSSNLRPSSGFADSACAILSNRLSCGIGSPRLTLGREPISSRITPAKRFWDAVSSTPCHAAARVIASRSRFVIERTDGLSGSSPQALAET